MKYIMQHLTIHLFAQLLRGGSRSLASTLLGRKFILLLCVGFCLPLTAPTSQAQSPGDSASGIAQREIARRANRLSEAETALDLGRAAYAKNDYEEAVKQYGIAY